jgi:very-short-patch-repair endonuclease
MASGICGYQRVSKGKLKDARKLRKKMTPAEALLWEWLRDRRCGGFKFRRQQIIKGFVADFYCEQAQTAIELDGNVHDSDDVKIYDARRDDVFASYGIKTVRFKNEQIENGIKSIVGTIAELCKSNLKISKLTEWECKRNNAAISTGSAHPEVF